MIKKPEAPKHPGVDQMLNSPHSLPQGHPDTTTRKNPPLPCEEIALVIADSLTLPPDVPWDFHIFGMKTSNGQKGWQSPQIEAWRDELEDEFLLEFWEN